MRNTMYSCNFINSNIPKPGYLVTLTEGPPVLKSLLFALSFLKYVPNVSFYETAPCM